MRATEKTLALLNFRASLDFFIRSSTQEPPERPGPYHPYLIPNETWETFIVSALAEKGIEYPGG